MGSQEQLEELEFNPMSIYKHPVREDIVGQSGKFVDDFILSLKSAPVYKTMGIQPDKTFLITGKPGTGKTLGTSALINEVNKIVFDETIQVDDRQKLIKMFGMQYDIGKYGTAYINMGSVIAQQFFDTCYEYCRFRPTVILFDEAEVLFSNRANSGDHKEDNKLLNTIMKNMQTVHDTNNLYAILMSNYPEAFDDASIRAGRIDKRYEFTMPDAEERKVAYQHSIDQINKKAGYQVVRNYSTDVLAELTKGYSYADIAESVNAAVKQRAIEISRDRKPGVVPHGYIRQNRLEDAIAKHQAAFKQEPRRIGF